MDIDDQQMMVLEQLTYLNDDVYKSIGKTSNVDIRDSKSVKDIVDSFSEEELKKLERMGDNPVTNDSGGDTYISGREWAATIRQIKSDPELMKLQIDNVTSVDFADGKTSYNVDAMTFYEKGNSKDAIVCFRGTLNGEEWVDDAEYLELAGTDCNQQALSYIENLSFSNITVIGHSKGGNKAAYCYYLSDKVHYCLAMDAPGFPPEFYYENLESIKQKDGAIKCYALDGDFVNVLMLSIPNAEYIYCKGFGLNSIFENHSPNSFFDLRYDNMGQLVGLHGSEKSEQSDTMKTLHEFTSFLAIEMPYGQRIQVADYLGDVLGTALGGSDMSAEEMVDLILSDPEKLATVLAYFSKYNDLYDAGLILEAGDGFLDSKIEVTVLINAILLFMGKDFKDIKKANEILSEKRNSGELDELIKLYHEKYSELGYIQKKDLLDYSSYQGRKYNYTKSAYEEIMTTIKEFEDAEYERTGLWQINSDEEWFGDIKGAEVQTALSSFIEGATVISSRCKTEFENGFNEEWEIDSHYFEVMGSYMRRMSDCTQKVSKLRDRLQVNK